MLIQELKPEALVILLIVQPDAGRTVVMYVSSSTAASNPVRTLLKDELYGNYLTKEMVDVGSQHGL